MPRLDRQTFEELSEETNFQIDVLEKFPPINQFLTFTKTEESFITQLFDKQNYRPEILFETIDYNRSLRNHPGIEWRLQNLGK